MSDGRISWLLFAGAFLARFVLYLGTPIFGTDSAQFLLMAQRMGEGRFHDALLYTYHPLFPLLTAAFRPLAGGLEPAGFWVSMLLGSAAVVPLYRLALAVFGRRAAVVAALLYAVQSHTVEVQADVMSEGTFAFFFFGAMWMGWSALREPSVERSILAGMAAVAAYLTRAEGILAVVLVAGWLGWGALSHRRGGWIRVGGLAACVAIMLVIAFPFLLWVRAQRGAWMISNKESVRDSEAVLQDGRPESASDSARRPRARMAWSMVKMTHFVAAPFMILGLLGLRGRRREDLLFYFSFPVLYLAALAWTIRYFSPRYVIPSMNLLMVLAGLGFVEFARIVARRWSEPKATWISLGAAALIVVVMAAPAVRPRRIEETAFRGAGRWLAERKRPGDRFFASTDKLNFLAGGGLRGYPLELRGFQEEVAREPAAFYVFTSRDLASWLRPYSDWLRGSGRAGEPIVIPAGRPGGWDVTILPARGR